METCLHLECIKYADVNCTQKSAFDFIAYFQLPNVACKEVCEITSMAVKACGEMPLAAISNRLAKGSDCFAFIRCKSHVDCACQLNYCVRCSNHFTKAHRLCTFVFSQSTNTRPSQLFILSATLSQCRRKLLNFRNDTWYLAGNVKPSCLWYPTVSNVNAVVTFSLCTQGKAAIVCCHSWFMSKSCCVSQPVCSCPKEEFTVFCGNVGLFASHKRCVKLSWKLKLSSTVVLSSLCSRTATEKWRRFVGETFPTNMACSFPDLSCLGKSTERKRASHIEFTETVFFCGELNLIWGSCILVGSCKMPIDDQWSGFMRLWKESTQRLN